MFKIIVLSLVKHRKYEHKSTDTDIRKQEDRSVLTSLKKI